MTIRQLLELDVAALQHLRRSLLDEPTLGPIKEREEAVLDAKILEDLSPPATTFGAFDEFLIGAVSIRERLPQPFFLEPQKWYGVTSLMVRPDFRGKGFGRALIDQCVSWAVKKNAEGLLLVVNSPNPSAIKLYESCGFKKWDTAKGTYESNGEWFDTIHMSKLLNVT
jgi:ribosomal protein S18 acetylase RimI-like enzyme